MITKNVELSDLLKKVWFSYDKKITSVIRSLGFNSVQSYQKSNQRTKNYYRVMEQINSEPKNGVNGIYNNLKELTQSTSFNTILWIESNIEKYMLFKESNNDLNKLAGQITDYFSDLKQLPFIQDIQVSSYTRNDTELGSLDNEKQKDYLSLSIHYSSDIAYNANDYSYFLKLGTKSITQNIILYLSKVDISTLKSGNIVNIIKEMIDEKDLRNSFLFRGPCMFVQRGERPNPGCLGNRESEYSEIVRNKDIHRYIMFITDWLRNYVDGESGPYQTPANLSRRWNFLGLTDNGMTHENTIQYRSQDCSFYKMVDNRPRSVNIDEAIQGGHVVGAKNMLERVGKKTVVEVCTSCVRPESSCSKKSQIIGQPERSTATLKDLMEISTKLFELQKQYKDTTVLLDIHRISKAKGLKLDDKDIELIITMHEQQCKKG